MKIAFTGKGGSGKSTLAALFVAHLRSAGSRVLAIDADVNVHLAPLLGVTPTAESALSHAANAERIRAHLAGTNPRIGGPDRFVPTSPPGPGSGLVQLGPGDPLLAAQAVLVDAGLQVMHVGTYESEDIGAACYHSRLGVLEGLLSHLHLGADDWVVCDMVAGTDAFASSLHAQFDLIVVATEPTPESTSVAVRYRELAAEAGVADLLAFVGNKLIDDGDLDYLRSRLGEEPLALLGMQGGLRRARQAGTPPRPDDLDDPTMLDRILERARTGRVDRDRREAMLRALHLRFAEQAWVQRAYGDITGQLAPVSV